MKPIIFKAILFIAALSISSSLFAQTVSERLDALFTSPPDAVNGNVLAAENGKVIYKRSFGFADFKTRLPNTDSSRFNIASISKTFTAVAVLQLKEKGRLGLDDAVKKYLPEFPYADITIRHLLSHTSGLPDVDVFDSLAAEGAERVVTNRDVLPSLNKWKTPLELKPGEKWSYSNVNYNLLALLVEKVSGRTFEGYLQENIFAKANMFDTYLLADYLHVQKDKNRVVNHKFPQLYSEVPLDVEDKSFAFRVGTHRLSGLKGDGDIISTTGDLLKYNRALYSGLLLRSSTLAEALTPTRLNNGAPAYTSMNLGKSAYGLGWFIFEDASKGKIVFHTGGIPGALSILLRNISKHQTVILLDNANSVGVYRYGVNAMNIVNGAAPALIIKRSIAREYARALLTKTTDIALSRLKEQQSDTAHYYLDEDEINNMALALLDDTTIPTHTERALEALKLNTVLFPQSYNTYDSYGEALAKTGKTEEAITMYKKSLELNPDSESGKKALERLVKK